MNQRLNDIDYGVVKDFESVEGTFKIFWEKVKHTSDLIKKLKEERRELQTQNLEFKKELEILKNQVSEKNQEIRKLKEEQNLLKYSSGGSNFTPGEIEVIKNKIRDILVKINSYL